MKRWICPTCGKGKMAPSRMKAEDSRRFCFLCSEETGMLVRRVSPALEKAREKAKEKAEAKAKAKRAKEAKARARKREQERKARSVGDLDLHAELKRLSNTKPIKGHWSKPPVLTLKRARTRRNAELEWNWNSITYKVGTQDDAATAAAWLCMALGHITPINGRRRVSWNNEDARDLFCELAEKAYRVDMMNERWEENADGTLRARGGWQLVGILADKLRDNKERGGSFKSPPKQTKPTIPTQRQYGVVTFGAALREKVLTFLNDFDEYLDDFDPRLPGLAERLREKPRVTVKPDEIEGVRIMLEEAAHEVGPLPDVGKLMTWLDKLEAETGDEE